MLSGFIPKLKRHCPEVKGKYFGMLTITPIRAVVWFHLRTPRGYSKLVEIMNLENRRPLLV